MKFYTYGQNNSGGGFDFDAQRGISNYVVIQAANYRMANFLATEAGLYFDGVERGSDCGCCGDRWYAKYDESDANGVVNVYGIPFAEYIQDPFFSKWMKPDQPEVFVHLADGRIIGAVYGKEGAYYLFPDGVTLELDDTTPAITAE